MAANGLLFAVMTSLFITLLAVSGMETSVTLHARDRFHFTQLDLAWFFLFMGVIVAGMHTNEIFIENGRFHGKKIAEAIALDAMIER